MSLGMTNVLVKRMSQKGFVMIKKVSARRVSYVLTPDGMNELALRTVRYLKRTMKKVVNYKETIMTIVRDASDRGYSRIGILGNSDINFIIEYAATHIGLAFAIYTDESAIPADSFIFVSENWVGSCTLSQTSVAHLYELLTGEI